jgi:two-component system OmpR family sensor kinase
VRRWAWRASKGSPDDRLLRRTAMRMGLQSALVVAVAVMVLCGVAVLEVLRDQHADQANLLATTIARADDANDPPEGVWLVLQRGSQRTVGVGIPSGLPSTDDLAATAADGVARDRDVHLSGAEYAVRTQKRGDTVVQAIMDLRAAHAERGRLLRVLLATGLAGLVLAGVAGAWLGRRAVTPLAEALAMQRRFVADAGHELRTPLTLLSTRAQLLRRRARSAGPATLESDVDDLVADAAQLTDLLEDLLLAADPRQEVPRQLVKLTALVRQVVTAAEPAAAERGVRLLVEGEPVTVTGYEAGLRRALIALLDNGIRHARSTLRIVVGSSGRQVRVDFADDGPGIDPAIMPTMFRRFASGAQERSPGPRRRYGLGLSLVSDIAARHGGSVSAGNGEEGGAILRLLLPR